MAEQRKIWIGIPAKVLEKAIEEELRKHIRKLINYPYVKNVVNNELMKFINNKLRKNKEG